MDYPTQKSVVKLTEEVDKLFKDKADMTDDEFATRATEIGGALAYMLVSSVVSIAESLRSIADSQELATAVERARRDYTHRSVKPR